MVRPSHSALYGWFVLVLWISRLWDLGFCCTCAKWLRVNVTPCLLPVRKGSSGQFATAPRALGQPCSVSCVLSSVKGCEMLWWPSPCHSSCRPSDGSCVTSICVLLSHLHTWLIHGMPSGIGREVARPWKRWQVNTGCCGFQISSARPATRPRAGTALGSALDVWLCV